MKKTILIRTACLFLACLLALSFSSCTIDLDRILGLFDPSGDDGAFTPSHIEEVVKGTYEASYRDQLNTNELAIYDLIAAATPGENEFTVSLPERVEVCRDTAPTEEEKAVAAEKLTFWITNALYALWLDVPSLFWMETGNYKYAYMIEVGEDRIYAVSEVSVTVEKRETITDAAEAAAAINEVLDSLSLERESDAQTVRAINDYLCEHIDYVDTDNRQNIYGALVARRCVCEGYAHAFKLLCDRFGVTCATLIGTGITEEGEEGHMWNAVLIDGAWYAVDVTWNDSTESDTFLLVGKDTKCYDTTFAASHILMYTRGTSKQFAAPILTDKAYKK